jgi:hypothetical protein
VEQVAADQVKDQVHLANDVLEVLVFDVHEVLDAEPGDQLPCPRSPSTDDRGASGARALDREDPNTATSAVDEHRRATYSAAAPSWYQSVSP